MAFMEVGGVLRYNHTDQTTITVGVEFAGAVWPLRKVLVLLPPVGRDYVNRVYLRETVADIIKQTARKNFLSWLSPLRWKVYICSEGHLATVRMENLRFESITDLERIPSKDIRRFFEAELDRQRAALQ